MSQTFSCLNKLGGTTNLKQFLFGHVKGKWVFLSKGSVDFCKFDNLECFFVITHLKIIAVIFQRVEKMRLD